MIKRSLLAIFAVCSAAGAMLGAAMPASAWSVRQNGAFCMQDPGGQTFHNGAGTANHSSSQDGLLACPVIDTSATPKTGITALSVVVVDNSTTQAITTNACIQLATGAGGQCGAASSTSVAGTGVSTLSPARTRWTGANDFPYIFVSLPKAVGSNFSRIDGYSFSG
jgi:hypothetical protein